MSSGLSKNILTTAVYYDILDYPMTGFEVWKHLTEVQGSSAAADKVRNNEEKYSLHEVIKGLEDENLRKVIEEYRGFYFLKGRQGLVEQRLRRNKISERKYRSLLRVAKILRFMPFVRMIAATGRLAMKNAEKKSDLDLLIVLEHGKIFTGRLLVTLAVHLLGKRRYKGKIADRVCLNYFITARSLEIGLKDMYSASEYSFMVPLFGREIFKEFQRQNSWIKNYKPNYQVSRADNLKMLKDTLPAKIARWTGEKMLGSGFIENVLKEWQLKRINKNPKTHQTGSEVAAGDSALIFLPNPQGPRIYERFQERLSALRRNARA